MSNVSDSTFEAKASKHDGWAEALYGGGEDEPSFFDDLHKEELNDGNEHENSDSEENGVSDSTFEAKASKHEPVSEDTGSISAEADQEAADREHEVYESIVDIAGKDFADAVEEFPVPPSEWHSIQYSKDMLDAADINLDAVYENMSSIEQKALDELIETGLIIFPPVVALLAHNGDEEAAQEWLEENF